MSFVANTMFINTLTFGMCTPHGLSLNNLRLQQFQFIALSPMIIAAVSELLESHRELRCLCNLIVGVNNSFNDETPVCVVNVQWNTSMFVYTHVGALSQTRQTQLTLDVSA